MWGRNYAALDLLTKLGTPLMFLTPSAFYYCYICCENYTCSLVNEPLRVVESQGLRSLFNTMVSTLWGVVVDNPHDWVSSVTLYISWMTLQILFYLYFPSPIAEGQLTPAGNKLIYRVNGWRMMVITHIAFAVLTLSGVLPAYRLFDLWPKILVLANIFGFGLSIFSYIKAHYFPTHPDDCKVSGNWAYDFYMGIECNPRIGNLDFKLFFNGRPGIGGWDLINFSFMAAQYHKYGYVSNSLILVTLLQALYVGDFFWNEAWYLKTIDIAHDHFGWMLSWGDSVWLPCMYTLQGFYLVYNPVVLEWWWFGCILALGGVGYFIFRGANSQKDYFRAKDGKCDIWGKPATFVQAEYSTSDGRQHKSKLLTSGFWGLARHFNYVGDLAMSLAFCLPCGFKNVMPYFYIIYMTLLLVHRSFRDSSRLKHKYGESWAEYCKIVPNHIIPGVF
ncbi:7-dehydrocholesterol reductase [Pelomyxa schiedti]|nr:7-dehydrocholesterol reductase [Pelomyxa schiedti]